MTNHTSMKIKTKNGRNLSLLEWDLQFQTDQVENWIGLEAIYLLELWCLALSPSFSTDLLALAPALALIFQPHPATATTAAPFSPAAESPHLGFHFDAADTSRAAVPK